MIARIYIRVSTDEQSTEGYSLAAQEERCRQFIQSQGWELGEIYRDDGYSAKNLNRPAMQKLIHDAKNGEFDVLVIYRLDRLVRSVMDLHQLLQLFDKHQVSFKSVTEVFDTTTAMGRFFITLVGAMSQWERENLSERVKMAVERRFMEGNRLGHAPYGYREDGDRLVIDPDEAAVVRWMFKEYQRNGMNTIAKKLNKQGISTRNGRYWNSRKVHYVLTNPLYAGHIRYRPNRSLKDQILLESDHETIIHKEEFEKTQQMIRKRSNAHSSKALTSDYPFSGVLICGRCGAPMTGRKIKRSREKYYSYRCTRRQKGEVCDMPEVSERKMEKALFDHLDYMIPEKTPDTSRDFEEDPGQRIAQIEKELERIRGRRKRWQEAYANEAITLEELIERTKEDGERERQLKEELETVPTDPAGSSISYEEFQKAMKDIRYVWKQASRADRKELIHNLFHRIVIDKGGDSPKGEIIINNFELS